eukprot:jgi/Mesen1/9788/ME000007S09850
MATAVIPSFQYAFTRTACCSQQQTGASEIARTCPQNATPVVTFQTRFGLSERATVFENANNARAGMHRLGLSSDSLHANCNLRAAPSRKALQRTRQTAVCKVSACGEVATLPEDYADLIEQVKGATQAALADGKKLLEIDFPTAGLDSVPGDMEGGIEMTESMRYMREFCSMFVRGREGASTRIFFPDANEVAGAQQDVFGDTPFQLDYLTKISGFEDIGFSRRVKMADRVRPDDKVFVVAYPYFNVNEMLAVDELYKEVAEPSGRPVIVFNGELDRIRSGYYPPFFYPKLGKLAKNLIPLFETTYYLHNFKGRSGGKLFRVYPGPWQVLRGEVCIHTQEKMPTLKEVALDILPRA